MKLGINIVGVGILDVIAHRLNTLSSGSVWNELAPIISMVCFLPTREKKRKQLIKAAKLFNELAKKYPIPLRVIQVGDDIEEQIKMVKSFDRSPTHEMEDALRILEKYFFHGDGWERLKKCPQCGKWFVDDSRNKKKERCSPHCTWQFWSWDRRKKAGHRNFKPKKKK